MGALAPDTLCPSDDDDKLISVTDKDGASLEQLAKEAVEFSQTIALEEAEDQSLQNNGQVEGSEHSPSTLSHIKGSENSEPLNRKRKNDSMDNSYHVVLNKKRVCESVHQNGEGKTVCSDVTSESLLTEPDNSIEADVISNQNPVQMNDSLIGSHFIAEEVGEPDDLSVCRLDDIAAISSQTGICDDNYLLNNFGYFSPLPDIPDFDSLASICFELPDAKDVSLASCMGDDGTQLDIASIRIREGILAEMSEYLLEVNEEEILKQFDGKDVADAYDLSSLLINVPMEDNIANIAVSDTVMPANEHQSVTGVACPEDFGGNATTLPDECQRDVQDSCTSETQQMLSPVQGSCTSEAQRLPPVVDLISPERRDGVICCVLSTEDMEIPCNDHVIFAGNHPQPTGDNNEGRPSSPQEIIESQILTQLGINLPFIR